MPEMPPTPRPVNQARSFLVGGLLPVIAFTIIDEYGGPVWGVVAGMVFGVGEIIYEKKRFGKVETMTWVGTTMLLVLGAISFLTSDGVWFKMQPAILEAAMGLLMLGSVVMRKPFLALMAKKQGVLAQIPPEFHDEMNRAMSGFTLRVSLFFLAHAAIAAYAALYWSTAAWAALKGLGFTLTFLLYVVVEGIFLRRRMQRAHARRMTTPPA
jgi:intracellular septation protein